MRRSLLSTSVSVLRCIPRSQSTIALEPSTDKIGIIGGGRMAEAMLRCFEKSFDMKRFCVYDSHDGRLATLKARYGITPVDHPDEAVDGATLLVR